MYKDLDRILKIVEKSGDKCIFYDKNAEKSFVIMPFLSYERLILRENVIMDLTQEELLDKINRDIATWKAKQKDENIDLVEGNLNDLEEEIDDQFYLEPLES